MSVTKTGTNSMITEIETREDLSTNGLTRLVEGLGLSIVDVTFVGVFKGWMDHRPESTWTFRTLAGAKRSARKWWDGDNNHYVIVYIIYDDGVGVNVATIDKDKVTTHITMQRGWNLLDQETIRISEHTGNSKGASLISVRERDCKKPDGNLKSDMELLNELTNEV